MPNGCSVYSFLKRKETVICMGQRNGTVVSKQALNMCHTVRPRLPIDGRLATQKDADREVGLDSGGQYSKVYSVYQE